MGVLEIMNMLLLKDKIKKNLLWLIIGLLIFVCVTDYFYYYKKLYPGIYLKDVYLGNKTLFEVEETLNNLEITIQGPDQKNITVSLEEIGVELQIEKIIYEAYQKGRESPWPLNIFDRLHVKRGTYISMAHKINEGQLYDFVDTLAGAFDKDPQDVSYEVQNGEVVLVPEKVGYRLQKEKLVQEIIDNLGQKKAPLEVTAPIEKIHPNLTVSQLKEKGVTNLMASYTTYFDASKENRSHNIALGASELNQLLIAPGEIFSFNQVIGDTTPQKGYKEAPIIQGGDYTTGFGGGICQISSTLYNAVILSNLEVMERHNHRYMAPYISAGRDATVFQDIYDLKFKNNLDHYILISTDVEGGKITIALVGAPVREEVEITTREIYIIEPPQRIEMTSELPSGEEEIIEGIPGGEIEVWRVVQHKNGEKTEEKLSVDTYQPYPTVIRRGIGEGN